MKKFYWYILSLVFTLPELTQAAEGLVPCGRGTSPQCTFQDFIEMVNSVMGFLIFYIAVPLTAIVIIYAGSHMIIYASNSSKRSEAKGMIKKAVWGLVIVLAAFVIVKFITTALTADVSLIRWGRIN